MNIAIWGAGHWHSPIYLNIARDSKRHQLIAVQDADPETARKRGEKYQIPYYESPELLLAEHSVDFVVILGTFKQATELTELAIARRLPFLLEKPGAMNAMILRRQAELCRDAGLFHAPALIPYWYPAFREVKQRFDAGEFGRIGRIAIRYLAGPAERYLHWHCPWVIDPQQSPGGALINLGVLCLALLRMLDPNMIFRSGVKSAAIHRQPLEDFSTLLFQGRNDSYAVVETGYTPIEPSEGFYLQILAEKATVEFIHGKLSLRYLSTQEELVYEDRDFRLEMMTDLLDRCENHQPSPLSLFDMAEIMAACEGFYLHSNGIQ